MRTPRGQMSHVSDPPMRTSHPHRSTPTNPQIPHRINTQPLPTFRTPWRISARKSPPLLLRPPSSTKRTLFFTFQRGGLRTINHRERYLQCRYRHTNHTKPISGREASRPLAGYKRTIVLLIMVLHGCKFRQNCLNNAQNIVEWHRFERTELFYLLNSIVHFGNLYFSKQALKIPNPFY